MIGRNRTESLGVAVRLSVASVLWNAAAGTAATVAGVLGGSLALLGFGLDSVVDGAGSCVLIWRFRSESSQPGRAEELERRAARAIGTALALISLYVGGRALIALPTRSTTGAGLVGIVIAGASILVLPPLSRAKRRTADHLGSRALRGDSVLTAMGAVLAASALLGLAAAQLLGWWWADSVMAVAIAVILGREAVGILRG
ncbi:MAG: cobalt transporter [Candidatus Dormibacteria bacterium]|jgi:divalent metal cation (Fe/Co/Zn/Cd) transporter